MQKKNFIISEGARPFWQSSIAAMFYTLAIILLGMFFFRFDFFARDGLSLQWDFTTVWLSIACISQGILFSAVKNVFFDLSNRKYKEEYCVGPIKVGKWRELPKIDYVSIFKQPKKDGNYVYETNLWYQKNRHFNIYDNIHLQPVIEMGESVAKILKVDLLDATESTTTKWKNL